MSLNKLGVIKANEKYKNGEFLAVDMVNDCTKAMENFADKNAVIEVFDDAVEKAKILDEKRANGEKLGKLAGTVVLIKDNILVKGKKATACSKFLKNFESIYNSTVAEKMLSEDAIILGRTNMDEFAMGNNSKTSCYGITKNAIDDNKIAGGSSSGSSVAVALDMCNFALGTDTGGSTRIPAIYNGVCGVKPTYGLVSRNGVYAYASSFDQVGAITKNVEDSAYVLEILAGNDIYDMTSTNLKEFDFSSDINKDIVGKVFAVEKNLIEGVKNTEYFDKFNSLIEFLKAKGALIKEIEIDNVMLVEDAYKIIAYAEASSNLARYDGLKYTTQTEQPKNAEELYVKSRSEGFGEEVKNRIMLGNYILSKNNAYQTAKNFQQYLINQFNEKMQGIDGLILPMTLNEPEDISLSKRTELNVVLAELANLLRVPSMAIPYEKGKNNLPLGVQVLALENKEKTIYQVTNFIEKNYKGGNE